LCRGRSFHLPPVDAEVVEQGPEVGDELAALREALQVRLHVAVRRGVEQRLHPEKSQHLPGVRAAPPRTLMIRKRWRKPLANQLSQVHTHLQGVDVHVVVSLQNT